VSAVWCSKACKLRLILRRVGAFLEPPFSRSDSCLRRLQMEYSPSQFHTVWSFIRPFEDNIRALTKALDERGQREKALKVWPFSIPVDDLLSRKSLKSCSHRCLFYRTSCSTYTASRRSRRRMSGAGPAMSTSVSPCLRRRGFLARD
jgi:hypothetical protein